MILYNDRNSSVESKAAIEFDYLKLIVCSLVSEFFEDECLIRVKVFNEVSIDDLKSKSCDVWHRLFLILGIGKVCLLC